MIAIRPNTVAEIDRYAEESLRIPVRTLMERAGRAVAAAVRAALPTGGSVLLLCGGGNNGGDGYAAACLLTREGITARAADVTGRGQASEAGRFFLDEYRRTVGEPLTLAEAAATEADVLVDAVLGSGARLPLGEALAPVSALIRARGCYKIAVDLPLGVDAGDGLCDPLAVTVDETVCLGFFKEGLFSYPARGYCGRISCDGIGLDTPAVIEEFGLSDRLTGYGDLAALLPPPRAQDSHKGTYGHLLAVAGSQCYRGAALLSSAAALRMGAGLVTLAAPEVVLSAAIPLCPEVIPAPLESPDAKALLPLTEGKSAILVGPGLPPSEALRASLAALLSREGCPLILDAGALTVLADDSGLALLKGAKRKVILTPHPGEFARLVRSDTAAVGAARLPMARAFAEKYPVTLVLKGAGTVISCGTDYTLNTSGGPALAKGGSGDVLAGAIASAVASGLSPTHAARLSVFLHGAAADRLAERYSPLGVRPSDLPAAMAELLAEVYR